jgi:AcrR family transcriptional regulator
MDGLKEDKITHIIEAAIDTIRKYGISKTTIEDVGGACGMSPASLYYYFQNKTDIVRAAIDTLMNRGFDDVDEVINSCSTIEEKLAAAMKSVILRLSNSGILKDMNKSTRSEMLVIANEFADHFNQGYKSLIKTILSEGSLEGVFYVKDIELTASVLSTAVFGYIMSALTVDQVELSEVWVDEMGKLLMYGLKKR